MILNMIIPSRTEREELAYSQFLSLTFPGESSRAVRGWPLSSTAIAAVGSSNGNIRIDVSSNQPSPRDISYDDIATLCSNYNCSRRKDETQTLID